MRSTVKILARIATGLVLGLGLSACVDANLDVALTSDTSASATLTQVMRQDAYRAITLVDGLEQSERQAAIKAAADAEKAIADTEAEGKDASSIIVPEIPPYYYALAPQFCVNGRILKRVDGGATCMDSSEGAFADIALGDLKQPLIFTPQADGTVRIALPTAQLREAINAEIMGDPELTTIIPALFASRKIVIRFSGEDVTDTNMTLAKDKKSASQDISILDLLSGKAVLPAELYAVVRAPND